MNITEDFVSIETVKLLKEKGFNEKTHFYYHKGFNELQHCFELCFNDDFDENNEELSKRNDGINYSAPTLQMAMKWLREVHEIFIEIPIYSITKPVLYRWNAFKNGRLVTDEEKPKTSNCIIKGDDKNPTVYYYKYEECCEAAIKYCLTNLI